MSLELIVDVLGKAMNGRLEEVNRAVLCDEKIKGVLTTYFAEIETRSEVVAAIKAPSLMNEYLGFSLEDREEFAKFINTGKEYLEGSVNSKPKSFTPLIARSTNLMNLAKKIRLTNLLLEFFDFYLQNRGEAHKFDSAYLRNDPKLLEKFGSLPLYFNKCCTVKRKDFGVEIILPYAAEIRPEILVYAVIPLKQKPKGWLETTNGLIEEVNRIKSEHGLKTLPPADELHSLGYSGLIKAIYRHGGFRKVRELLGEDQVIRRWKDKDKNYVIVQLRDIMAREGWEHLPSSRTLDKKGYSNLTNAIYRNYKQGGFRKVRELLGEAQLKKEEGYWKKWENVERELIEEIDKNGGKFPSKYYLCRNGKSSLAMAIRNHGGPKIVRERLMSGGVIR